MQQAEGIIKIVRLIKMQAEMKLYDLKVWI
jgi:hypothetical protein